VNDKTPAPAKEADTTEQTIDEEEEGELKETTAEDATAAANADGRSTEEEERGLTDHTTIDLSIILAKAQVFMTKNKRLTKKHKLKGTSLGWAQDDEISQDFDNYPTVKGCGVLSVMNGHAIMHKLLKKKGSSAKSQKSCSWDLEMCSGNSK
jgi:hypothetical protein